MLGWALAFFMLAIAAAAFGFGGIAGASASIAQVLFVIFLALTVVAFVVRAIQGRSVVQARPPHQATASTSLRRPTPTSRASHRLHGSPQLRQHPVRGIEADEAAAWAVKIKNGADRQGDRRRIDAAMPEMAHAVA